MAKEVRYLKQVVVYLEEKYGKDKAKSIITKSSSESSFRSTNSYKTGL